MENNINVLPKGKELHNGKRKYKVEQVCLLYLKKYDDEKNQNSKQALDRLGVNY